MKNGLAFQDKRCARPHVGTNGLSSLVKGYQARLSLKCAVDALSTSIETIQKGKDYSYFTVMRLGFLILVTLAVAGRFIQSKATMYFRVCRLYCQLLPLLKLKP